MKYNIMKKYIIEDWAGNRLFPNKSFETYEDGWAFIYNEIDNSIFEETNNDDHDNHQDYFVVKIKQ